MSRPEGRKPHTYKTIATICGKLCLGQNRRQVAREVGVTKATVDHVRQILWEIGALKRGARPQLPAELHQKICELVRTPGVTNQQIKKRLGLACTINIRARRKVFHDALRAKGELVPRCQCGDEFQHAHKCPFKGISAKPLDPGDTDEAIKDLQAGVSLEDLMRRFSISQPVSRRLLHSLTPKQHAKRQACLRQQLVARRRRKRGVDFNGLPGRLDAAVPRTVPHEARTEVLQDMFVSILSGEFLEKEAVGKVRSFVSKAYSRLGDQWGTVSIDMEREGIRFVDMIEDERALGEFSALDELE